MAASRTGLDRAESLSMRAVTGALFVLCVAAFPVASNAQQRSSAARIGILWTSSPGATSECLEALREGLRETLYTEGENIVIEQRWAADAVQRLDTLASELIGAKVQIIVTQGTPAARAAKQASRTIPIVMATGGDPVGTKLVNSLARPGGNVTGLTLVVGDLSAKRLELVRETNPRASRVTVIVDPTNPEPQGGALGQAATETAARSLGLQLHIVGARGPGEFEKAFAAARAANADFVIIAPSPILSFNWKPLVDLAAKHRLPTMFGQKPPVDAGGLMSYGPNYPALCRRAAVFVDKILKGAKPADLPIEQPMQFDLAINRKTAKTLGLTIPKAVLLRANHLIE